MATKYPQYKVAQWIDTSEESMSREQATLFFGVQIRTGKGEPWRHCHQDGEPLLFDTPALADEAIERLKATA